MSGSGGGWGPGCGWGGEIEKKGKEREKTFGHGQQCGITGRRRWKRVKGG